MQKNNTIDTTHTWLTDKVWISGLAGAIAVLLCAAWYNVTHALTEGVQVFGFSLTHDKTSSLLLALVIISAVMLLCELTRLLINQKKDFFAISPHIKNKNYGAFLGNALATYAAYVFLLWLIVLFFRWGGEYGFQRKAPFYQAWFLLLDTVFNTYLWIGLPYTLITQALKFDPLADKNDPPALVFFLIKKAVSKLVRKENEEILFTSQHKKIILALLVKLFFAPLMTVFFVDQFPHLVSNVGYVFDTIPNLIANGHYNHQRFNGDFFNISITVIFSIDVALAWCGYMISSRWVNNQTQSAEPTLLGWMVCIVCYPPFQMFLGLYFSAPGEREVLRFSNQTLITIFTGMMLLSYLVYMSATLFFGVRFSNLTNRGIIRKGPYAIVRHPAYASKNFAWWCVMFPAIIYNATTTGVHVAILQTLGLVLMTWVYYMRAITEEKHLSVDPDYQAYCQQVRYRFIPKLF